MFTLHVFLLMSETEQLDVRRIKAVEIGPTLLEPHSS